MRISDWSSDVCSSDLGLFCACLPGCPPMLSSARTPPCLLTLILVSALSVVSLTMFLPSLASIATAFGADYGLVNLSIAGYAARSEEHTSELQSLMSISYAVFCLKKKKNTTVMTLVMYII